MPVNRHSHTQYDPKLDPTYCSIRVEIVPLVELLRCRNFSPQPGSFLGIFPMQEPGSKLSFIVVYRPQKDPCTGGRGRVKDSHWLNVCSVYLSQKLFPPGRLLSCDPDAETGGNNRWTESAVQTLFSTFVDF